MQTVLVVDDETSFLDILQVILERAGYRALLAPNGTEGLKMIYEQRPDLVVLDDMLPGISGCDICFKVKSDASTNAIPVIVYSAGPRIRDREFIKKIGANAVLNKPFRPKDVVSMIDGLLCKAG